MKKCSSLYIFLAFAGIIIILLCVVLFAYKPHFAETLSNNNADWGNFGQFFWGLGTMLFTALNVVVLVFVNEQLREYNDLQQEHQDDLKLQIEDNRKQFQMEMLRQKRIDNWLNIYYQIILRLANSNIKSDAEWLSMLRNLTRKPFRNRRPRDPGWRRTARKAELRSATSPAS